MADNPFVAINNGDGGGDIRGKLNIIGDDSDISMRYASEFAEIENEIGYFITGTIVFAKAEAKWYRYNGTIWVEETDIPALEDVVLKAGSTMIGDLTFSDAAIQEVDYIKLNTSFADGAEEGRLQWNADDGTPEIGMPGGNVNLQMGQEHLIRASNKSGSTISNGIPVYISGAQGGRVTIEPADADISLSVGFRTIGVATEEILDNASGYVTVRGIVRDINTLSYSAGDVLYLAVGGGFTTTPPTAPNVKIVLAVVQKISELEGEILVALTSIPNLSSLSDLLVSSIADDEVLAWDSGDSRWENKSLTFESLVSLEIYDSMPERSSVSDIHGGLLALVTGQPLDSFPTDINETQGIGKIIFILNAGSDFTGSITITGTSVNRDTGMETSADTDVLSVDSLSTDSSDTDANGNVRYSFSDAYISSKWFTGSIVISTSDLTLTDVDVYHCSFEQFDDSEQVVVETFDINLLTTHISARFDAYLYSVIVSGNKVVIAREASLNLGTPIADRYYRLRRGNLNKSLNGTVDGVFINLFYSNSPAYIEDVNMKVWAKVTESVIIS